MRKIILGILIFILTLILAYKLKTDIEAIKNHNTMNIEQVEACSEYLRKNPDGICD